MPQVINEIPKRYKPDQIALIKSTFDEATLMALRKFLLQGELSVNDSKAIKDFSKKPQAIELLRIALTPELDTTSPLDGLSDLFGSVDFNTTIDYANYDMEARQTAFDYFQGRFKALKGKLSGGIDIKNLVFSKDKEKEQNYIDLKARNVYIIQHVEFIIKQLKYFYDLKEETPEQQAEREKKDSAE